MDFKQTFEVQGITSGSCGIVVRSKPVPVKTSEEYWVKILWKAEALGGHQGLAELVWKLLLSGGTVGKFHIFLVYKIFEQRTKKTYCIAMKWKRC